VSRGQEKHLAWVQHNRCRPRSSRRLGDVARAEVENAYAPAAEAIQALAQQLLPIVDDVFRGHCRLVSCDGGHLVVHVDPPEFLTEMRYHWLARLQGALPNVRRVTFRAGADGLMVPRPPWQT
jgi:hypothetical protein